ncbi:response regulator [Paraburkholderia sp. SIMBA_054]|uniref:response regulator n=1 Tax=Paraburkholderia sp. SIMBA_054 TaxID=3085795 RepID=UPI00397ADD4F
MATILLVDDDVKILRPLRVILEAEGYDVLTAEDGEAAVAVTAFGRPDLIVTDWMMPGVDGVELCRRVRADPATAGIPIVVLTAASGPYPVEAPWNGPAEEADADSASARRDCHPFGGARAASAARTRPLNDLSAAVV